MSHHEQYSFESNEGKEKHSFEKQKELFEKYFPEGKIQQISLDDVPEGVLEEFEIQSKKFISIITKIFKVMFKPVATGQVEILTKDFSALLNDGLGTKTNLNLKSHLLVIKSEIQAPLENISEDREAPEKFSVEIIKNENLFENQWALVFSAQDKGSGINHYEVRETSPYLWQRFFQSRWQVTEDGPYLLKDQNLNSLIKVKAIDNLGNEKESIIQAQNTIFWYQDQSRWVIMISVILSVFFLRKALFGWFLKCNKV